MPMTNINNEHEQMISVLNQLIDEREILSRENEYLRSRLNESLLIETMNEMRKERSLLFKLLSNLTTKHNYDEQVHYIKQHLKENYNNSLPPPSYPIRNDTSSVNTTTKQDSSLPRHNRSTIINNAHVHRLKPNIELHQQQQQPKIMYNTEHRKENSTNNLARLISPTTIHWKPFQTNKKFVFYKIPQTQESNKSIRKHDMQLKHSQNSPFQRYRSQSLQNLT
ncbi:unnamed protein product [Adineta steineri]|uniref:Uncharacterized protein n=1 Tax=Adineta steineri TaxID=433720 RepID=A0A814UWU2_9BILA|nr:unnamed protein product [Adineta steineri]CAF3578041.1 unnamed protein product [Adineta steineri]